MSAQKFIQNKYTTVSSTVGQEQEPVEYTHGSIQDMEEYAKEKVTQFINDFELHIDHSESQLIDWITKNCSVD